MIPKIIHYCWFGGNPLPEDVKKYIATWQKYCPNYEIRRWDETNFDVTENQYCKEAYEAKKWAFVSDYVRLKVLHDCGGFYMDTDVEVVKSLDPLCAYDAVSGYESKTRIATGTMGACRDNEWINMLLHDYDNRHFVKKDGTYDQITNVEVITQLTVNRYHMTLNGGMTSFGQNMIFLPFDYLCAKSYETGEESPTQNTYTIHHFAGSWLDESIRKYEESKKKYYYIYQEILPNTVAFTLAKIVAAYECNGIYGIVEKMFCKLKRNE